MLAKVTDQLEHQYAAHKELEKLRLKQEAMLLREKERQVSDLNTTSVCLYELCVVLQISHLKSELHQKKTEHKRDKLHIESLELETKFLRSQNHENGR